MTKTPKLSLYKDLMTAGWESSKEFTRLSRLGTKHAWRQPGPAQWTVFESVKLRGRMTTVPRNKALWKLIDEAQVALMFELTEGFRTQSSYRRTNRQAISNLRSFYTNSIKPEIAKIKQAKKARKDKAKEVEKEPSV